MRKKEIPNISTYENLDLYCKDNIFKKCIHKRSYKDLYKI